GFAASFVRLCATAAGGTIPLSGRAIVHELRRHGVQGPESKSVMARDPKSIYHKSELSSNHNKVVADVSQGYPIGLANCGFSTQSTRSGSSPASSINGLVRSAPSTAAQATSSGASPASAQDQEVYTGQVCLRGRRPHLVGRGHVKCVLPWQQH
ncbi:unnamed protein product, partial [Prorocentrum cordatum]